MCELHTCPGCGKAKPLTEYPKQKSCLACHAKKRRERYHSDPEVRAKQIAATRKWQQNNPHHHYLQSKAPVTP